MNAMTNKTDGSMESPLQTGIRTGLTAIEIRQAFLDNLVCGMGRIRRITTNHDLYFALALTVWNVRPVERHPEQ